MDFFKKFCLVPALTSGTPRHVNLAKRHGKERVFMSIGGLKIESPDQKKNPVNAGETQHLRGSRGIRLAGLEPAACGLGNRRSIL